MSVAPDRMSQGSGLGAAGALSRVPPAASPGAVVAARGAAESRRHSNAIVDK
jgi:hypothetical protein